MSTFFATQNLFPSSDPTVDLALVQVSLGDVSRFDVRLTPTSLLTTDADLKALNIAPGTDLFFSGMFSEYLGTDRMEPMVRFGRVSLLPYGKVSFGGVPEDLILAEVFSFGGNSGSPVFYYQGIDRSYGSIAAGPPVVKLAGVMQGFFPGNEHPIGTAEPVAGANTQAAPGQRGLPVFPPNSGIAAIVPAQKILDILNSAEVHLRQR